MTDLVSAEERLAEQKEEFLEKVKRGIPRLHAAVDVGWTPRRLSLLLANAEFFELVTTYEECINDEVEMVLLQKALAGGNMEAIKMWLLNRRPERWADKREVNISGEVVVAQVIVDGTREGLRAMLESPQGADIVAALTPGGALDAEVCDAELLD